LLLSRRRFVRDIREVVRGLEELRLGRTRSRAETDAGSPLALVFDAINRMGQDVAARVRSADHQDERMRAVMAAMGDSAVVTTDLDGDVQSFNATAVQIYGWPEEEMLNRPVSLLFEEEAYKEFLPKLARRTLREQGVEMRADLVRRDGSGFRGEIIVRLLVGDRRQESSGYMIVVRDITSQVRLEQELRESELRYRSLVEGLAEGVFILQDGRITYANPAMRELAGQTNETLVGHLLIEHIATTDLLVVEDALSRLANHPGDGTVLRCTLIDPDREPLADVRMQATGIVHEGKPAVLVSVFDETIDRQVEGELRRNEARLDAVLEATSDGIVVFSDGAHDAGVIRMTNRAFVEMFGLDADRVLGSSEGDLMDALIERGGGAEGLASFLGLAGVIPRIETVNIAGEDDSRVIELKVAPLMGRNGELLGRVLACRDLTDWKVFERNLEANADRLRESNEELEASHAKLREVNAELLERAERVEHLNHELKTLDEMKSSLLGNVSHELQTPLVSIRGYTEMILKGRLGPTTDEQHKGLTLALKNIDRLISMIDNLLAFARMEGEAAEIKIATFPLRPMIQEAVELLREKATARSIDISVELGDREMIVQGDRDRIHQVFLNLIANAIKFNRADGSVVVAARPGKPGYAQIEVRDTGIGIPEEETERVFDRYYQVGVETPSEETGSGIGLAIVRDILRLHGCTIRVESSVGQGSVFRFTLPLAENQGEESETNGNGDPEPDDNDPADTNGTPQTPKKPRFRIIRHN